MLTKKKKKKKTTKMHKTTMKEKNINKKMYLLKPGLCFFADPTVVVCESCE